MPSVLPPTASAEAQDLTDRLRALGASDDELSRIELTLRRDGVPFSLWNLLISGPLLNLPEEARPLLKPYATLKWLLLEDPPPSRDRDEAWVLVAMTCSAPSIELGQKTAQLQSDRAKKSRGRVSPGGQTSRQIIERVVEINPTGKIQQYWETFFRRLDEAVLAPRFVYDPFDEKKVSIEYETTTQPRKKMSFARFKNIISEIRRKKSHDSRAVDI
jgi:hypothetical protein